MPIDAASIDDLALVTESHFAAVKRSHAPRALILFDPSDDTHEVMKNAPGPTRYLVNGKIAVLSCDPESLFGYLKTRSRGTPVPLGIVTYGGEEELRFKQTDAPLGTLAVTTAITNLQEARLGSKPYVLTSLAELVDLSQ